MTNQRKLRKKYLSLSQCTPIALASIYIFFPLFFFSSDDFQPTLMEAGEDPLEFDFKKAYEDKDIEKMDELLV